MALAEPSPPTEDGIMSRPLGRVASATAISDINATDPNHGEHIRAVRISQVINAKRRYTAAVRLDRVPAFLLPPRCCARNSTRRRHAQQQQQK